MKIVSKKTKSGKLSADEFADMAMSGKDISSFFSNKGEIRPPVQRVNVDFTIEMLRELDEFARELNISRQAVIKSSLRQVLDQHNLAKKVRPE